MYTYRIAICSTGRAAQNVVLPNTTEELADNVARALRDAGADWVDVYEQRDGREYHTGWFKREELTA